MKHYYVSNISCKSASIVVLIIEVGPASYKIELFSTFYLNFSSKKSDEPFSFGSLDFFILHPSPTIGKMLY